MYRTVICHLGALSTNATPSGVKLMTVKGMLGVLLVDRNLQAMAVREIEARGGCSYSKTNRGL